MTHGMFAVWYPWLLLRRLAAIYGLLKRAVVFLRKQGICFIRELDITWMIIFSINVLSSDDSYIIVMK